MAVETQISLDLAQDMADQITAKLDAGTGAIIAIFDGTKPTETTDADAGTRLATILCNTTCFGAAGDGAPGALITANGVPLQDTNAAAAGTAQYFRVYPTTTSQVWANVGACAIQGTVGTATSDMILDSTSIALGGTVSITAWTMTLPES